jgi:CTP synthase (UTP-ammonia lyase)
MEGALAAIGYARAGSVPFLGTCAGFQYAVVEFARYVVGIDGATHVELESAGEHIVSPLSCSLVDTSDDVRFVPGSRVAEAYGAEGASEAYRCNSGLNPTYRRKLEEAGLVVTGVDDDGEARVVELRDHPFFVATLFQPELSALRGTTPPLVKAFVRALPDARPRGMSSGRSGAFGSADR